MGVSAIRDDKIIENHIYERNFFETDFVSNLPMLQNAENLLKDLSSFQKEIIPGAPEAQLEQNVIGPILDKLGWFALYRQPFIVQGQRIEPDYILFASREDREAFLQAPEDAKPLQKIAGIWEDKAEDKPLDTGKTDPRVNPYFQLLNYLNILRKDFGFLCNGHEYWFVDNSGISVDKKYIKFDMDALIASADPNALRIFNGLFANRQKSLEDREKAQAGLTEEQPPTLDEVLHGLSEENARRLRAGKRELQNIVYGLSGHDSLFEKCGQYLAQNLADKSPGALEELHKNCLYFMFRLIFIAFFEYRHSKLLAKHEGYKSISLYSIYQKISENIITGGGGEP